MSSNGFGSSGFGSNRCGSTELVCLRIARATRRPAGLTLGPGPEWDAKGIEVAVLSGPPARQRAGPKPPDDQVLGTGPQPGPVVGSMRRSDQSIRQLPFVAHPTFSVAATAVAVKSP